MKDLAASICNAEALSMADVAEPVCIDRLFAVRVERTPDAVAVTAPGRASLSYAGLYRQVQVVLRTLSDMGLGREDRVAIVLPSGPEMAVTCFAVAAGAVSAPLNHAYRAGEFDFYLSDLKARAVITCSGTDSPAREVARVRDIPVIELTPVEGAEAGVFRLTGDRCAGRPCGRVAQPDDLALVIHTSGTTSRPKIVPLTHANLCISARNTVNALSLGETDRCLNLAALFHLHGLMVTLASLLAGGSVACPPRFDATKFFAWLEELRPTWYTAVPTVHQAILARVPLHRETIARCQLRVIRSSSSALPPRVRAELEQVFGAPVAESYGMTEAAMQITSNPLPPRERKVGSVGVAAGPELAIIDERGNKLPSGQVGEIVIRGPNVIRGYESDAVANARAFIDGWLKTGDQGYLDAEGFLFITGRLKEIINRGGEKISPREVEEVLMEHPAIAQAVAFPVPHVSLGEDVAAAVVLREGAVASEWTIREFAARRLAEFKVPRQVLIVPSIPTGPTGKWQRGKLAEQVGLLGPDEARGSFRTTSAYVPPLDPLELQLTQIWEELFGVRPIGVRDDFFDLGGYSLLAARMVDEVERACGFTVPPSALSTAPTVELLARELLARRDAAVLGPSLIKIRSGGSRLPFVLLNGDYNGGGFYCRNLAARLHPEQPFYTLSAHGSNGDPVPPTIEAMAEAHLETLCAVQPDGPYLLGGFSNAGLIAFEMAQRLRARGRTVSLLVVIDKSAADPRWHVLRALVEGVSRLRGLGPAERRAAFLGWRYRVARLGELSQLDLHQQISYVLRKVGPRSRPTPAAFQSDANSATQNVGRRQLHMIDTYDRIVANYIPRTYPGRVTVIASMEGPASRSSDPTLGWGRVAAEVKVLSVPGDHLTCITKHVDIVAERLRVCLDEVQE